MGLHNDMLEERVDSLAMREAMIVSPEASVREAIEKMRSKRLGCVIVGRQDSVPLGVFTEHDVMRILVQHTDTLDDAVEGHLGSEFACVRQADLIAEVLKAMGDKRVRFVCVTDDQGRVVAVTGHKGLMEYIADHFAAQVMTRPGGIKPSSRREGA